MSVANKAEIQAVVARASQGEVPGGDACQFDGCAYWRGPKHYVTLNDAAAFIRWQCLFLTGEWDRDELQRCCEILRRACVIVDVALPAAGRRG